MRKQLGRKNKRGGNVSGGLCSRRAAHELAQAGVREKPQARLATGQRGHPSGFILLPSKSSVMTSEGTRWASVLGGGFGAV